MIFATVGTQLPFDRLLLALDAWAAANRDVPVLAQTGATGRRFGHIETVANLGQPDYQRHLEAARLVVSHAGMGTILSAVELGKPAILMARRASLGEHRNDHQIDTAREMARLTGVTMVEDAAALHAALDAARAQGFAQTAAQGRVEAEALAPLLEAVRGFVWEARGTAPGTIAPRRPARAIRRPA
jgi:UDP-N-acetylglucosamine transferase subunit ALG13